MVIVRLIGGIGNQMFQYAAARRLAVHHQTELKLDLQGFKRYTLRGYSLGDFDIQAEAASRREIARLNPAAGDLFSRAATRLVHGRRPYRPISVFFEARVSPYNPAILETPVNVYLEGYWQTEKYFLEIQDQIRRELRITTPPDEQNREWLRRISERQAVSLHIRRGDYVTSRSAQQIHGSCSLEYYREAARRIADQVPEAYFFVFSDDPSWAIHNLNLGLPTSFVNNNSPEKGYEDLRLISRCHHHIIANSSFSWWGAWLSSATDKIVVAPKDWFRDPSLDSRDVVPEGWLRL